MAYCLVDGKVEQESEFEANLYNELLDQMKKMKAGFPFLKVFNTSAHCSGDSDVGDIVMLVTLWRWLISHIGGIIIMLTTFFVM